APAARPQGLVPRRRRRPVLGSCADVPVDARGFLTARAMMIGCGRPRQFILLRDVAVPGGALNRTCYGSSRATIRRKRGAANGSFSEYPGFVRVAEAESFAEAARQLGVANSVVTQRIKQLEEFI